MITSARVGPHGYLSESGLAAAYLAANAGALTARVSAEATSEAKRDRRAEL